MANRFSAPRIGTVAVSIGVGDPAMSRAVGIDARTLGGRGVCATPIRFSIVSMASRNAIALSNRSSRSFSSPRRTI